MSVIPPPAGPSPADPPPQAASRPQPTAPITQAVPVQQGAPVTQAVPTAQGAPFPAAVPSSAVPAPAPRRRPRRGALVGALVVAIALLVGSVGATAVWAHDSRGPFASARPGIERLGGPQSGGARVSPGMPGKMFNRQPGAGQVLPHRQAKPSPSPTATTGY